MRVVLIAVCACVGWCAASLFGCQSVREAVRASAPEARVTGASVRELTLERAGLVFNVALRNRYDYPLPLVDLEYELSSGGTRFAEGTTQLQGVIAPNAEVTVEAPVVVLLGELLDALEGVRPGGVVPYEARLTLVAESPYLERAAFPVEHRGSMPIPAAPEVRLARVDWEEVSLSRVSGRVAMDVTNTNAFTLASPTIAGRLALGGREVGSLRAEGPSLQPGETGSFETPISFSALGAGRALLRGELSYELSGDLRAGTPFGLIGLPFARSGRVAADD